MFAKFVTEIIQHNKEYASIAELWTARSVI